MCAIFLEGEIMTTFTKTIELNKTEDSVLDASKVSVEFDEETIVAIAEARKAMIKNEHMSHIAINAEGIAVWQDEDSNETGDRMFGDEIVVFNDGSMIVSAFEKYSCHKTESAFFKLNQVEEALKDFDPEEQENIAYENKQMAEALSELGFSDEDVSNICNGSLKVDKKQTFLVYSTNEFQSLDSYTLEGVTSSLTNAHEVVKKLFASYKYNVKAVIKVTEIDSNSFEDFEVYDYNYGLEWKNKISDTEMGFLAHLTD